MAKHNIDRLAEDVKREISSAMREVKDSRVSGSIVTVSRVELTSDLSYCKVYVSVMGGEENREKVIGALKKASGFFKRRINSRIKMHKLPELIFLPDDSLDYYEKISRMIDELPRPADEGGENEENEENDEIYDEEDDR